MLNSNRYSRAKRAFNLHNGDQHSDESDARWLSHAYPKVSDNVLRKNESIQSPSIFYPRTSVQASYYTNEINEPRSQICNFTENNQSETEQQVSLINRLQYFAKSNQCGHNEKEIKENNNVNKRLHSDNDSTTSPRFLKATKANTGLMIQRRYIDFESINTNEGNQNELSMEKTENTFNSSQGNINEEIEQDRYHQGSRENHLNTRLDNPRKSAIFKGVGNETMKSSWMGNTSKRTSDKTNIQVNFEGIQNEGERASSQKRKKLNINAYLPSCNCNENNHKENKAETERDASYSQDNYTFVTSNFGALSSTEYNDANLSSKKRLHAEDRDLHENHSANSHHNGKEDRRFVHQNLSETGTKSYNDTYNDGNEGQSNQYEGKLKSSSPSSINKDQIYSANDLSPKDKEKMEYTLLCISDNNIPQPTKFLGPLISDPQTAPKHLNAAAASMSPPEFSACSSSSFGYSTQQNVCYSVSSNQMLDIPSSPLTSPTVPITTKIIYDHPHNESYTNPNNIIHHNNMVILPTHQNLLPISNPKQNQTPASSHPTTNTQALLSVPNVSPLSQTSSSIDSGYGGPGSVGSQPSSTYSAADSPVSYAHNNGSNAVNLAGFPSSPWQTPEFSMPSSTEGLTPTTSPQNYSEVSSTSNQQPCNIKRNGDIFDGSFIPLEYSIESYNNVNNDFTSDQTQCHNRYNNISHGYSPNEVCLPMSQNNVIDNYNLNGINTYSMYNSAYPTRNANDNRSTNSIPMSGQVLTQVEQTYHTSDYSNVDANKIQPIVNTTEATQPGSELTQTSPYSQSNNEIKERNEEVENLQDTDIQTIVDSLYQEGFVEIDENGYNCGLKSDTSYDDEQLDQDDNERDTTRFQNIEQHESRIQSTADYHSYRSLHMTSPVKPKMSNTFIERVPKESGDEYLKRYVKVLTLIGRKFSKYYDSQS